jgi:DNA-binding transcriptional MerR regulator
MNAGTRPETRMRVAELARAAGTAPDTIRYYERAGLLPKPPRSEGGYRLYGRETVERLRFIQGCQRLGLRLRDIADLLHIRDTGECSCAPAAQVLTQRLAELDEEMARLAALRAEMAAMLGALPDGSCPPPGPETSWCPPEGGEPWIR